jgi:hypothetical protein
LVEAGLAVGLVLLQGEDLIRCRTSLALWRKRPIVVLLMEVLSSSTTQRGIALMVAFVVVSCARFCPAPA